MLLEERFKYFRKELGLSQKDIAQALSCTTGKIKQIERGITKSINYDDAKILENKYNIREQWLRFEKGKMLLTNTLSEKIEKYEDELKLNDELITLPYYEDIKASAGNGYSNIETKKTFIKIPKTLVPTFHKHLEIIKIDGDSMEKTIYNNDLIFVDKNDTEPKTGKVYIFLYENELFIKRYFKLPNEIILRSDNSFYPDLKPQKHESLIVIGRVLSRLNIKEL